MNIFNIYQLIIASTLSMVACVPAEKKEKGLNGYNLQEPEKFFMPESLLEISGIAFKNGHSDTVYAVQDEEGKLFRVALGVKKQYHTRFAKKGDFEDLSIIRDRVFVLRSNGSIVSFPLADATSHETHNIEEWKRIVPKGEFEGIYGDEKSAQLYMLCKNCAQDNPKQAVSGFIFHATDSLTQTGTFQLNVESIRSKAGNMKAGFKPSGLAQNPVTKEWFIISAVNKLLVVTDGLWQVREVAPLPLGTFNQPEGIAFDNAGNLYISNEGGDLSQANILKFKRLAK
jgi:uncharacterized protein YjiK